ncbi:Methyltransferase domain-containing protein [Erythrobacter litoralis]|nr:Methyltransferase domain-containing protein [Erythrobacter litoralis]
MYNLLKSFKGLSAGESHGRHLIRDWSIEVCRSRDAPVILDIGAGRGEDILTIREQLPGASLQAIETFPVSIEFLKQNDVSVSEIDIEKSVFPFESESIDLIICNQVYEHLKEIFWLTSEIERVLRPDGAAIIGVPNLGSLHNRLLLLAGQQPAAIHVLGPHVRGFTVPGLRKFFEAAGSLKVERVGGSNFYPFGPKIARLVANMMPRLAVSSFYLLRRTNSPRRFLDLFDDPIGVELVDTPFYRGSL